MQGFEENKTHGLGYLVSTSGEFDEDLFKIMFSYMYMKDNLLQD